MLPSLIEVVIIIIIFSTDLLFKFPPKGIIQHWGMGLGNPLLPGPIYNKNGQITFISNRVLAHHIGFCGSPCQSLSYRMLLSYSRHWGTYDNPLNEIKKQFAPQQLKGWSFTVSGAMDRGSLLGNNYGGMLVIRKQGIIKSGNK